MTINTVLKEKHSKVNVESRSDSNIHVHGRRNTIHPEYYSVSKDAGKVDRIPHSSEL